VVPTRRIFRGASTEARVTFISLFLTLTTAADHFRALGNHGLSLDLDGGGELRGKGVTDVFLLLARVWPTVALIAVPFGTVTIVVGCGALLETLAAFGVSASSWWRQPGWWPWLRGLLQSRSLPLPQQAKVCDGT